MQGKPLVSIVIPVYNRENYIEDCVICSLNQTYKNIEVIVVDNNSTDNTWQILQSLAVEDKRLKIYRNDSNIGPVKNWKIAIDYSSGEYIKILWSDDIIDIKFLEYIVPYLERDGEVGFVYSKAKIFTNNNDIENSNDILFKLDTGNGIYSSIDFIKGIYNQETFLSKYPYSPACALFRAKPLKKNIIVHIQNDFGIDFSKEAIGNDLFMFLLTAIDFPKFAYCDKVLVYFRRHSDSISTISSERLDLIYHVAKSKFFDDNLMLFTSAEQIKYNTIIKKMLLKNNRNIYRIKSISQLHHSRNTSYNWFEILKVKIGLLFK